jgi:hypothetical protein
VRPYGTRTILRGTKPHRLLDHARFTVYAKLEPRKTHRANAARLSSETEITEVLTDRDALMHEMAESLEGLRNS